MIKEKRILSYILGWLIVGFIIIFIGVNNVFAASYNADNFTAQIYDNINGSLTSKTTTKETTGIAYYYSYDVGYTAYSSGGAWGVSSPIPLIANHTYSMTVDPMVVGCGFTILSSINRLGVGTTLGNAVSSYQNNTNVNEKFSQAVSNSRYLQYVFTPTINASYIVFPYSTTSSCSGRESQLSSIVIEDLGESGVSQDQINTSLNNQTNELNNSIQNSTDTIINNQNQNNEELKDSINENFNTCRPSYNLLKQPYSMLTSSYESNGLTITLNDDYTVTINGTANSNTFVNITRVYNIFNASITGPNCNNGYCLVTKDLVYDNNNNVLYFYGRNNVTYNNLIIKPMITTEENKNASYEPYGQEICSNKIDETNDKLDGIQGALTDSSSPNTSGLENSAGWLPAGPLDSVLNLPLSLFNALTTNLNKSCNSINIPLPYVNKNITLPCINTLYNQIGITSFLSWIGVIVSGLMLYTYLLKLYKWIEDRISLNETHNVDSWGGL